MGIGEFFKQKNLSIKRESRIAGSAGNSFVSESSLSLMRSLAGGIGDIGDFFFPPELIGGVCPRVAGKEEAIVWNAAVEACDSERVHIVWQSAGNCIWYLAIKSEDLASNTNSWCPLATLLPSANDLANLPVCYTYFGEDQAVLMSVTAEELRIFRGTVSVIRAKAERISREYGNKVAVNIDPFRISQMTPIPWYSASLFEDRARRILAALNVFMALSIVGLSFLVWLVANMAMVSSRYDLSAAAERSKNKTMKLLNDAERLRSSPLRERLEKFLEVNDGLLSLNGFLTVYEIKDNVARWKATVPPSATADRISALGGKSIDSTDKGVSIGNDAQIDFEAKGGKK